MKSKIIIFIIIICLLVGFLYSTKDDNTLLNNKQVTNDVNLASTTDVINKIVFDSKVKSSPQTFKFKEGEIVKIEVISDVSDELHLHGYDISKPISANVPTTLEFLAEKTGRFHLELESRVAELANIEIYPK